ncbi:hypothetical protein GCK72_024271 [Caenorhabditis remanei]|uniref:Uncharacterized protein n=2 Tax=Caenorhabditis remanei TaxID=31234 RepID=E3LEG2_CAERE|nr:hypothetical protein GCK72_024271 [Caenorhabditis remanei]EFO82996.1 hypothetical protein CRE_00812 [Caenorhabditis remanei]KAF1747805.1 hypothetical protein GCK72_024271 [Caenorhabditis remanei]
MKDFIGALSKDSGTASFFNKIHFKPNLSSTRLFLFGVMMIFTLVHVLLLATSPIVESASRVECHVVLECDPLTSCYSLKGGFPFVYGNKKEEDWQAGGKKYSMFLARNVETVRCVLLDKYEF